MDEQRRVAGQPPLVLGKGRHHRHACRSDEGLAEKPNIPAVLPAQQPDFFGEAPADLGIAAISEELDENGALHLQHGKKLIEKAGDHRVPDRPRQADRGSRKPDTDYLRNGRKLIRPPGHL